MFDSTLIAALPLMAASLYAAVTGAGVYLRFAAMLCAALAAALLAALLLPGHFDAGLAAAVALPVLPLAGVSLGLCAIARCLRPMPALPATLALVYLNGGFASGNNASRRPQRISRGKNLFCDRRMYARHLARFPLHYGGKHQRAVAQLPGFLSRGRDRQAIAADHNVVNLAEGRIPGLRSLRDRPRAALSQPRLHAGRNALPDAAPLECVHRARERGTVRYGRPGADDIEIVPNHIRQEERKHGRRRRHPRAA